MDAHRLNPFDLFEAQDIFNKLEDIIDELIQLLKKKASENNIPVKLMVEKLLDKVQEYAKKYLDKFEEAILNENMEEIRICHYSCPSFKLFRIPFRYVQITNDGYLF